MDVYAFVTGEKARFPQIKPLDKAKQLVYASSLAKGEFVFGETPLVIDGVAQTPKEIHRKRHNERWVWSEVEECLKTPRKIEMIFNSDYAQGIIQSPGIWEEPGDTEALNEIRKIYNFSEDEIKRLYDIFATNHLIAAIKIIPENGFNLAVPANYGFFLLLSRINHACYPSAELKIPSGPDSPVQVFTTRTVQTNEPLTIDYATSVPLEQKREALLKLYGFRCACNRCVNLCGWLPCNKVAKLHCPCRTFKYCSKQHQKLDWARHKNAEHKKVEDKKDHFWAGEGTVFVFFVSKNF